MKKIFTLLCCIVFAAQCSVVNAQEATMQVWKGGIVTLSYTMSEVDSLTFEAIDPVDNSKTVNGHKFVDLRLPSGLLWAETNVGAATAADAGNYYAWGEVEPQSSNSYSWTSYKYGITDLTKYNSSDQKTTLEKDDDAATVNWGDSCRMPTNNEFAELLNSKNCKWTWASMTASDGSSINGYHVISVKNGNSIFLPVSGYRYEGNLYSSDAGFCWTSSLNSSHSDCANDLYFAHNDAHDHSYGYRSYGLPVRPVAKP